MQIDREKLLRMLPYVLKKLGGSATPTQVFKYFWKYYAADLQNAGDVSYTWQYDLHWDVYRLRNTKSYTIVEPASKSHGVWQLTAPALQTYMPHIKKIEKDELPAMLFDTLKKLGGSGSIVQVCQYLWKHYKMNLCDSGDLFHTWQVDIRRAADTLRKKKIMKPASESLRVWELEESYLKLGEIPFGQLELDEKKNSHKISELKKLLDNPLDEDFEIDKFWASVCSSVYTSSLAANSNEPSAKDLDKPLDDDSELVDWESEDFEFEDFEFED